MSKCKRCHRDIKNPKSVQNGYGPVCWIKMLAAHPAVIGNTNNELKSECLYLGGGYV